jgi:hypothetical protein
MKTLSRYLVVSILILSLLQFTCLIAQDNSELSLKLPHITLAPLSYEQVMIARLNMDMQDSKAAVSKVPATPKHIKNHHWKSNIAFLLAGSAMLGGGIWCAKTEHSFGYDSDTIVTDAAKQTGKEFLIPFGASFAGLGILGMIIGF